MNAELGREYDVAKLVNACFEARGRPQARPGWGVISDRWNGLDAHGLVGSTTDGEGYAFAMNSFQWAGALAPLARYDTRYAHDIGKWTLNLANAARLFYPNAHNAGHQSSFAWAKAHDDKSVIAYEGIRKWKRGAATARADYRTVRGRIVQGSFASTHFRADVPPDREVFAEAVGNGTPFEHIWEFNLPKPRASWLVVAAERIDGGHDGNVFRFLFQAVRRSVHPAFSVSGPVPLMWLNCPRLFGTNSTSRRKAATDQPVGAARTSYRWTPWRFPIDPVSARLPKVIWWSRSSTFSKKPPFPLCSIAPLRLPPIWVCTEVPMWEFWAASSERPTSKKFCNWTS
jgi:hypothetical protein